MSNIKGDLKIKRSKCIFDSVEEINAKFGVELVSPVNIPDGGNFACYSIEDIYNVKFVQFYREDDVGLCYYNLNTGAWYLVNETLEKEILEDFIAVGSKYIYLRLVQQEDDKPKFAPERLLGVLTDHGYIEEVGKTYLSTEKYLWCDFDSVKFYISDDSDETVSFDEYVKLFYNTENVL